MTAERFYVTRSAVIGRRYRKKLLRRLLRFRFVLERGLHLLDDSLERGFVGDGEIGKNLAIESDVRGLQAFGETAVGETLRADGGVQALDPTITESALARFAIALGPLLSLHRPT